MFAPHENGVVRKQFQKPNILRRKPKAVRGNSHKSTESQDHKSLNCVSVVESDVAPCITECDPMLQIIEGLPNIGPFTENSSAVKLKGDLKLETHDIQMFPIQSASIEPCTELTPLNVESFLIDGGQNKSTLLLNIDGTSSKGEETDYKNKWCLNLVNDDCKDLNATPNYFDGSQISNMIVERNDSIATEAYPLAVLTLNNEQSIQQTKVSNGPIKFMCDEPKCTKSFWTEARLQKHKNSIHKKKSSNPVSVECPVKKTEDGVEVRCGMVFPDREQLMQHLNEDHTLEDASYRCSRCGRKFFWSSGVRMHEQGSCCRAFVCSWAGCGRVFRQPCRLREHARVHTGDRPYPCHYPNCGWSFRSASKLVRHSRRHTGERRHACAACGRAFLRREHLRDHAARHHDQDAAPAQCSHHGCEQTFANMGALYMHVRKVHRKEGDKKTPTTRKPRAPRVKKGAETFMVTLDGSLVDTSAAVTMPSEINTEDPQLLVKESAIVAGEVGEAGEEVGEEGEREEREGRSARTHCTWPLQRHIPYRFTLEDESQTDQPEGSENNIYTVRSDLFLHGNVLINEDSDFITNEERTSRSESTEEVSEQLDLGFVNSHPTIDLMQEELMYADTAVDESAFRVFLLNEEELS